MVAEVRLAEGAAEGVGVGGKLAYICFVDESGDESFKYDKVNSNWFVLSEYLTKNI